MFPVASRQEGQDSARIPVRPGFAEEAGELKAFLEETTKGTIEWAGNEYRPSPIVAAR